MSADKNQLGPGCLMLIGLPFLLAGLGALGWGVRSWVLYAQSRSWLPVQATVLTVELVEGSGGDGTTTYSVAASYRYDYGGTVYTGHRVDILGASTSSYGTHRRRYEELETARRGGKPVTAWVSPRNPGEALLYRDADTWMWILLPFGLTFAGTGGAMMTYGMVLRRRTRKLAEIAATDANRLWDARRDWAQGCVRAAIVKDMLIAWGWGLGLSLFMSMFVIAVTSEGAPIFAKIIVGLFLLVAALMVVRAVSLTLRWLAHGTPALYLSEVPVVPGRSVLAAVHTQRAISAERWKLQLKCYVPGLNDKSPSELRERVGKLTAQLASLAGQERKWRSSDWRGTCAFSREMQPAGEPAVDHTGRTMLPVNIEVPATAPGTSLEPGCPLRWVLEVKARSLPVSFDAVFELPIFYADDAEIKKSIQP